MLTPQDILQDIGFHCLKTAEDAQKMVHETDPMVLRLHQESLDEHLMWIKTLSLLLMPEEAPSAS